MTLLRKARNEGPHRVYCRACGAPIAPGDRCYVVEQQLACSPVCATALSPATRHLGAEAELADWLLERSGWTR